MKWIKLDGKKEPPADKLLLIVFDDNSWTEATLRRIEFTGSGRLYVFGAQDGEWDNATHFMEIHPPKNNQQ